MKRGILIAYDQNGKTFVLEGQAEGDIIGHEIPVGKLSVIELPFGSLDNVIKFKYTDQKGLEIIERFESVEQDEINIALLQSEGVI